MPKAEIIRIALNALRAHKLRSFLTVLGVIIGVATVIAVVSVIQGFNQYATSRVMDVGSTSFSITKFSQGFNTIDDFWRESRRRNLDLEDMRAVERGCKHCQMVAGMYNDLGRPKTVKYKSRTAETVILRGVTVHAAFIGQVMELDAGRHFTEADVEHARPFIILGGDVADRLFPTEDPIGKDVTVAGREFLVIGVAKKNGDFMGTPQDTFVRIPITVYTKMFNVAHEPLFIQAQTASPVGMRLAMEEARVILRARLHRMYHDDDGFSMATADTFLSMWKNLTGSAFLVTILVAGIALVVGGIVIMNIMLVSVTERMQEIGLRKAMGARQADILRQFLAESIALAATGGTLGVATGVFIAVLVSWFSPLPVTIRPWSVALALVVASTIGIFSGVYPARRAARLDPVVALRQE
jgi:putative ABC transport system permease protein